MIYELSRRNPKPTLLPTQGTFNLPHQICVGYEELVLGKAASSLLSGIELDKHSPVSQHG